MNSEAGRRHAACAVMMTIGLAFAVRAQTDGEPADAAGDKERTGLPWVDDRAAWRKLPMSERHAHRRQLEETAFDAVEASAERPWTTKRTKYFLAFSNADRKFTKRAISAADEFFEWCHEHFDGASDEYVRKRVLRIVSLETDAGNAALGGWSMRGLDPDFHRELVTQRDEDSGNSGLQFAKLFRDVLDVYLMDKDELLYRYMPPWFAQGFSDVAGTVYLKSGHVQFRPSDYERDELRNLARDGKAATLRQILTACGEEFTALEQGLHGEEHQFTKAARFFVFGPGRKHKLTRGFLAAYLPAVVASAEELAVGWDPAALERPDPEKLESDELAAVTKARQEEFERRRSAVTRAAFERVCGGWTERDWESIERAFAKYEVR